MDFEGLFGSMAGNGPVPLFYIGAILALIAAGFAKTLRKRSGSIVDGRGNPPMAEGLMHRLRRIAGQDKTAERKTRRVTRADRKLATKAVADMVDQVQYEDCLEALRGQQAVVARLIPRVPITTDCEARSWLGGWAALPQHLAWPDIDGVPGVFLAQICCADLPPDLWEGLGPRRGWLAFFIHPQSYVMRVLHLEEIGSLQRGPDPYDFLVPLSVARPKCPELQMDTRFPQWPVDIVAVRSGEPDPRPPYDRDPLTHQAYRNGYDLIAPEHQPFDWPSTLKMLEMAEAAVVRKNDDSRRVLEALPVEAEQLNGRIAVAEAAEEPPPNLANMRKRANLLPRLMKAHAEAFALEHAARPILRRLLDEARIQAQARPFSVEAIAPMLAELSSLTWTKVRALHDSERGLEGSDIEAKVVSMTRHDPETDLWVHEFESLRLMTARHAYVQSPSTMPPAVRHYVERLWKPAAASDAAFMGDIPAGFVQHFDPETEVTLLDLPSSVQLMGWMFGDMNHLIVTMTKTDLAAEDFSRLRIQVSN